MPRRFIAIEGLIGVGKTSLCRLLAEEWGARLILEPWEHNPFLSAFYEDRERYAFPAQMFYLATRSGQQMSLRQPDLFDELVVADYVFQKDRLFAEETLQGDEMELYDRFARMLGTSAPKPDFVLFLDAPTEVILGRIAKRGISSEQVIRPSYLDSLRKRYYALWDRYSDAPVYVLDTSTIDYTNDTDDSGKKQVMALLQGWLDGRPVRGAPRPYQSKSKASQMSLFGG
jgi:deoxyguanosine kinase